MKFSASKIWISAILVAAVGILFPPRRDTEQGRDRETIPSRQFLWSSSLYEGSRYSGGVALTARIDIEKLVLELVLIGALSGAMAIGAGHCCRSDPSSKVAL
jgi:hypothetical protein